MNNQKYHPFFKAAAIVAGCFLAVTAAYSRTPMNFFRAEGGLFQFVAHSSAAEQHNYLLWFFERSYHGHFTPLGFWLEFKTIQLAGTCEAFWRWRQIVMLAGVAIAIFVLVREAAKHWRASNYAASCAAAGVVAIFIYQPFMSDLLSWTFLVFQLVWILFSALALFSLLMLIRYPDRKRWIWAAVIFAYASMHALGLGLATVAATALILATLLFGIARNNLDPFRARKPTIVLALSLLIVISLAHALCMILLNGPPAPAGSRTLGMSAIPVLRSFGFVALDFFSSVQSLFVSGVFALPNNETIAAAWPLGLGMLVLAVFALFYLASAALQIAGLANAAVVCSARLFHRKFLCRRRAHLDARNPRAFAGEHGRVPYRLPLRRSDLFHTPRKLRRDFLGPRDRARARVRLRSFSLSRSSCSSAATNITSIFIQSSSLEIRSRTVKPGN